MDGSAGAERRDFRFRAERWNQNKSGPAGYFYFRKSPYPDFPITSGAPAPTKFSEIL